MDEYTSWKLNGARREEFLAESQKIAMIAEFKRNNPRKNGLRARLGKRIIRFGEWLTPTNVNQPVENPVIEAI